MGLVWAIPWILDVAGFTCNTIAAGLVQTIKNQEDLHNLHKAANEAHITHLSNKVWHYKEMFQIPPEGFEVNTKYPHLKIPISEGLYRHAHWIKQAGEGLVEAYTKEDGPTSNPYLIFLHSQPIFSSEPIEAIPMWFHQLLVSNLAIYGTLKKAAYRLDDWGVATDIACYCELDTELSSINAQIEQLNAEADAIHINKTLYEARLEAARAPKQLTHMELLAPQHLRKQGNK